MPTIARKRKTKPGRQKRNGRLRPQDEAFCQAIALQGTSGAQAYRDHIALGRVTQGTAQVAASRMLQDSLIALRIRQLREANESSIEERLGAGREQMVRYLVDAYQTPLSEINEHSPLAQSVKRRRIVTGDNQDEAGEWEVEEIKSVSRLDAVEKLLKMSGAYPQAQGANTQIPQLIINLGAMYSPASLPDASQGQSRVRVLDVAAKRIE